MFLRGMTLAGFHKFHTLLGPFQCFPTALHSRGGAGLLVALSRKESEKERLGPPTVPIFVR